MNETTCFEELFQIYYRELLAYTFKFVNNRAAAEDIVQDVFFTMWEKRTAINFKDSIKPYLYRLTHNKSINYLNSFSVQRRVNNTENLDFLINIEINDCDPYDTLLLKDITDSLRMCVETFPPQQKKVFVLSRQHYLKHKEIADLLNQSFLHNCYL